MDLWRVEWTGQAWTEPENLGSGVNTQGNDVFPFLHDDGTLYFASDGRRGLGGLDIFQAPLRSGRYPQAENMRSPINSPQDDFGLVFDPNREQGYFSSNRPGGQGGDDLYSLARFPLFIEGILVDKGTMAPLSEARVILKRDGNTIQQVRSDAEGRFVLRISAYESYSVTAFLEGYNAVEKRFETANSNPDKLVVPLEKMIDPSKALTLELKVIEKKSKMPLSGAQLYLQGSGSGGGRPLETDLNGTVTVLIDKTEDYVISADKVSYFNLSERISASMMTGKQRLTRVLELESYEIGKAMTFRDIRYEHAQTELNIEAKIELDQLARLMITNPSMVVEIGSHTDANGRNATNDRVSKGRAEEVVNYLVSQGVSRERLVAVGYGETKLLNHCADGVTCPEEFHRENRRTEWTIIQY
jgi:outer membrane protein OmpA-like peptidoglycan-associated protein